MGIAITSSKFEILNMCPYCGHKKFEFYGFKPTILTYTCLNPECRGIFLVVNDIFANGRPPLPPYHTHYKFDRDSRYFVDVRDKRKKYHFR